VIDHPAAAVSGWDAKAKDITRKNVLALLDTIADPEGRNAPASARAVTLLLSKMFHFALPRDLLSTGPDGRDLVVQHRGGLLQTSAVASRRVSTPRKSSCTSSSASAPAIC
jgi:hypothetical protein